MKARTAGPAAACGIILAFLTGSLHRVTEAADPPGLTFSCAADNDLYQSIAAGGARPARFDTPAGAVDDAPRGSAVLLLADGYPGRRNGVDPAVFARAKAKGLKVYVEYPESVPGVELGEPRGTTWERAVVASDTFAPDLPRLRILAIHDCRFIPAKLTGGAAPNPALVIARVAGFDTAVYGLPRGASPILFRTGDGTFVATTQLSRFVTGRYAPARDWPILWRQILVALAPGAAPPRFILEPRVRPAYDRDAPPPADAVRQAFARFATWYGRSGILVPSGREKVLHKLMAAGVEVTDPPAADAHSGDGSHGLLEGFASQILYDGNQRRRTPLRADCHGEAAMVLALHGAMEHDARSATVAKNLLDYVYFKSDLHGGPRGDPSHPAFGLLAWGTVAPSWKIATYGDDEARALLGTILAASCLESDRWDASVLKALLANLRTTGRLGFRGDRIDVPDLEKRGWKSYHDAETVNYALNFEAYPWACYLWAYRQTGEREFLDKARTAIGMTMRAYPDGWRWKGNMERARFLLPLAWLVRVEDTPEHRRWLKTIAGDLLKNQQPCGAIPEQLLGRGGGHYVVPASNEAYGTTETPLIQADGDPVSDQLYTTGFALLGLHEAAAATADPALKRAEDRLSEYLVRIQVRSPTLPYLDGAWFRAFDYGRWDFWASSADVGWGAWSVEAGWGQAWIAAVLGLRAKGTTFWEMTANSGIRAQLPAVQRQMSVNTGEPWAGR
jgi:hypothetical protein